VQRDRNGINEEVQQGDQVDGKRDAGNHGSEKQPFPQHGLDIAAMTARPHIFTAPIAETSRSVSCYYYDTLGIIRTT
jgi:hypothetical protein